MMEIPPNPTVPFDLDTFLGSLTQRPGVYRMLDEKGTVIYVGKAKNLKKRVSSYFQSKEASTKQKAMVARINSIDVRVTHSESEALLLECQLIKQHRPRYNITLRDDKSYPAIYVSTHETFPRVSIHRGARKKEGRYFGPYPSASAVRECLKLLQKVFPVRQCRDSFFRNRSRPCLEYQIKRCTAPCVGLVGATEYQRDVSDTLMFLGGDGGPLIDTLASRMDEAAGKLDYERAAEVRDQIVTLRSILEKQSVQGEHGDLDIMAIAFRGGLASIHVAIIRDGQLIGDHNHFPHLGAQDEEGEILSSFIGQYYLTQPCPSEILTNAEMAEPELLEEMLTKRSGHGVRIVMRARGERARRVQLAVSNAQTSLEARLASHESTKSRFESLAEALGLEKIPQRIECFDISHTQGQETVASCVVFDHSGPVKASYRKFNITGIKPGDDYGAIAQAVDRHYRKLQKGGIALPELLLIDGGKGQTGVALNALSLMGLNETAVFGVSKGPDRKPGQEILHSGQSGKTFMLPSQSSALLLVQQIRDEAHRFAITGHRLRRAKSMTRSELEEIHGLGPKRRKELLRQFGGIGEVARATVDALSKVDGINRRLAERIYDYFHNES